MSDAKLIDEIARMWVDSGGDEEGVLWCVQRLSVAIKKEIEDRKAADETENLGEQIDGV